MTKVEKIVLGALGAVAAVFGYKKWVEAREEVPPEFGSLSGVVTDIEFGLPIEGIKITLNSLTYTTIEDGSFEFPEVDAGAYTLVAIDPLERYGGETMSATIKAGEVTTISVGLTLIPTKGSLEVTVLDADTGLSIPGALVGVEGGPSGWTDANGVCLLEDIPAGTYTVNITAIGYYAATI